MNPLFLNDTDGLPDVIHDPIRQADLRALWQQRAWPHDVMFDWQDELDSTNTHLKAQSTLVTPCVLGAEYHTQGRGRRGHAWLAAPGQQLTFSMAYQLKQRAQSMSCLPLVVGLSLSRSLDEYGIQTQVKWPNDLLLQGKKLAGVLIEQHRQADTFIIGVGLNVAQPPITVAQGEGLPPIGLRSVGWSGRRDALLVAMVQQLLRDLAHFEAVGWASFAADWTARAAYCGEMVGLSQEGQAMAQGIFEGVASDGALIVRIDGVKQNFYSGDLRMRVADSVTADEN